MGEHCVSHLVLFCWVPNLSVTQLSKYGFFTIQ